jgi:uncharacterized protein with FMN-binding domain
MRRFVAVFVSTVAGLIVLLSFKTAPTKAPPSVALGSAVPGTSSDPVSSAPASSAAESPVPASSVPANSEPAATSSAAVAGPAVTPTATPAKGSAKPTPKPTAKPTPKPSATAVAARTVTGSAITVGEGRRVFGVVQVQLTIQNGKVISAVAVRYPNNESRSTEISNYSIPVLRRELLAAQGSSINAVSGATYTSQAYAQSAQAALDAAKA